MATQKELHKDINYEESNAAGNGPKKRMAGGDQTDDIYINDPETREKELEGMKLKKDKSTK